MELTDLHVHSTASDGTFTPAELVAEAKKAGLKAFALTDHDTVAGVAECIANGNKEGVEVIPGIEISCKYSSGAIVDKEIHIVGLFINYNDDRFLSRIAECLDSRDGRNAALIAKMNEGGFPITMSQMREMFGEKTVLTRAHFAKWMIQKGYAKDNAQVFDKYLGEGKPFYIPRNMPKPGLAVEIIRNAGGAAVLAHPLLYGLTEEELVKLAKYLKKSGLSGIEALYSTHRNGDETTVRRIAKECGLLISGGTDFHGANKPDIKLGVGHGNLKIPYELAVNLKKSRNTAL